jgi:hypothetical protein
MTSAPQGHGLTDRRWPSPVLGWRHPSVRGGGQSVVSAVSDVVGGGLFVLGALAASPLIRRRYNRWGVDDGEVTTELPGDDLVPEPDLGYTRGITVDVRPEDVWPWVAQIGQGRGGFYSYDGLENLFRCDIHSADRVLLPFQDIAVGDVVRLAPGGAPSFRVHMVDPPTALVLVSAGTESTDEAAPSGADEPVVIWQWVLWRQ